jgi:hypothetical protein
MDVFRDHFGHNTANPNTVEKAYRAALTVRKRLKAERRAAKRKTGDIRPKNCRFRLHDEGKPYPRSGCKACGRNIMTGLGKECQNTPPNSVESRTGCTRIELQKGR